MFGEEDVTALHACMNDELGKIGAKLDGIYYCPHHPEAAVPEYRRDCDCRKPKSGLIEKACQDFAIDLEHSLMVGDSPRDVECGEGAGVRGILYKGGSLLELIRNNIDKE